MLGWSGRRPALPPGPRERPMEPAVEPPVEPTVTLRVSCRGHTRSFLVSDPARTTWADVEAMVKVSFDLDSVQIKYLDEDNDEVSVNSKEEYEEALKIAVKQGNKLQMNAYEKNPACALQGPEKTVTEKLRLLKDEKKPLLCYSMLAQGLQEELKNDKELTVQKLNQTQTGSTSENPPEWFTSYLETFREQVVKETVEKLEQKLYEKLARCNQPPDFSEGSAAAAPAPPESPLGPGGPWDWLISCCNCQARIIGVRYQCSLCPAYNICEECEAGTYGHDPNHVLLKLRRPVLCAAENYGPAELPPRLPATLEQVRLQKQMDKRFLKAEKQRLRAEKKQRKAEVRELKKQLKLHRKIHLWNSVNVLETSSSPTLKSESLQPNTFLSPNQPFQAIVPTLSAVFVDENLPDGTHLQPGTKFIKHWRMKNTGNVEWSSDTKLKLMWGNLTLASSEKKDVLVPSLPSGQVGTVSVEFVAPNIEGTYTSHWRLSHRGEQFGPRIWCSIVVDPSPAADCLESDWKDSDSYQKSNCSSTKQDASLKTEAGAQLMGETTEQAEISLPLKIKNLPSEREFYIPSVDLLTAQDLLSFELLDINIVQELERVPHNTPVDMTPCMSPLPHDSPLLEKPGLGQIKEENEGSGFKLVPGVVEGCLPGDSSMGKLKAEHALNQEEGEEDMSGTQFVCETVIRSLTLDAAPDHKPPQKKNNKILQSSLQTLQDSFTCNMINEESPVINTNSTSKKEAKIHQSELMAENYCGKEGDLPLSAENMSPCSGADNCDEEEDKDDVQSQGSSASSEDYIIILPECFDTSRPLGESMYSSALSQPSLEKMGEPETGAESPEVGSQPQPPRVSGILSASQTLPAAPLTPETVDTSPQTPRNLAPLQDHTFQELNISASENISSAPHNQIPREEPSGEDSHGAGSSEFPPSKQKLSEFPRYPQGSSIAGELVKGALSVAASAYKALFAGPPIVEQQPAATEEQTATLLSSLCEMGFCDVQLNLQLLKKHNNNMIQVVTELLQISNSDWYSNRC